MANSNVKNASDKCEKRTSTRKATHTTRKGRQPGRQEGSSSKNKSQVRTHSHTREAAGLGSAVGEGWGGVAVVGVVCLKTPRTRARQNKLKF